MFNEGGVFFMGMDINLRFEYRDKNGKWKQFPVYTKEGNKYVYAHPDMGRDYNLFDALKDFSRGGIPKDSSKEVQEEYEEYNGFDAGSATYGTLHYAAHEFPHNKIWDDEGNVVCTVISPYKEILNLLDAYIALSTNLFFDTEDKVSGTRVVFWFDN